MAGHADTLTGHRTIPTVQNTDVLTFTSMYLTFLLVRVELDDAPGTTFILFTSSRIPRDRAT